MKVKLTDIADFNATAAVIPDEGGEILYFDTSSVNEGRFESGELLRVGVDTIPSRAQRAVKHGTILISTVRPNLKHYGIVSSPEKNMVVSSGFVTVDAKQDRVDSDYLYYLLISPSIQAYLERVSATSVSAYPSFDPEDLKSLMVNVPDSIATQKSISQVLKAVDAALLNTSEECAELENLAKLLYDYWFVQFDFPDENGKPYKSSGGEMVWNTELRREIPEGWGTATVGSISTCLDSKRIPLSTAERQGMPGPIPYYGATGIMDYVSNSIFDGEYVLLAEDGSVMDSDGHPVLQRVSGKCWINNHAHVLEPAEGYSCKLLMMILQEIPVVMIKTGSIQMKINQENLNNYRVPEAPLSLRVDLSKKLDVLDECMLLLARENRELASLRDFLLPLLMNGQVSVKAGDAE